MKQLLSPKQLAEAIGVSESSLKRWADDGAIKVMRTAGGHRRISLAEAVRYIRAAGLPILNPAALGLTHLDGLSPAGASDNGDSDASPAGVFHQALLEGHSDTARAIVLQRYLLGDSVAHIADTIIAVAMRRIGEIWEHSSDGIFLEHRATELCIHTLNQLRSLVTEPTPDAPVAVGGSAPGDVYTLPSLMAATVLAAEGWREMNLGADSPFPAVAGAARRWKARLIWISASEPIDKPTRFARELRAFLDSLADMDIAVVAGGRSWPYAVNHDVPEIHVAGSMAELAAFAQGLHRSAVRS